MSKVVAITSLALASLLTGATAQYYTEQRGQKYDPKHTFSLYFRQEGTNEVVSPWHDIPLYTQGDPTNQTLNMIVEIPRFTRAKFEIHRERNLNPIIQDVKDDKIRFLPNVFPWHGHICNYGAFPQTWENPFHKDSWTDQRGDKDPVDVCEVGDSPVATGTVLPVRVLGILAMIDSGETDWKVIVINAEEADSKGIRNMEDLEEKSPGLAATVKSFFTIYKVPAGKGENQFAYNGEIQDKQLADDVISFLHLEWKEMMMNCSIGSQQEEFGSFNTHNTKIDWSACKMTQSDAEKEINQQANQTEADAELPPDIWSFVPYASSGAGGGGGHLEAVKGLAAILFLNILLVLL